MKLFIAAMALLLIACHAQQKDTTVYKPDKHHFKFTEHGMYYNGVQFHLGDSIQAYVKIFGPYSRDLGGGAYAWDTLGMMAAAPPPDRSRISVIRWQVSYAQNMGEKYNTFNDYPDYPRSLIPEPLDIEKCDVLIEPNMRLKQLLQKTNCFYESSLDQQYRGAGIFDTSINAHFHHIDFYLDKEIYDEAEKKNPYALVGEFTVSTNE